MPTENNYHILPCSVKNIFDKGMPSSGESLIAEIITTNGVSFSDYRDNFKH